MCYTAGAKKHDKAGAGFCIKFRDQPVVQEAISLGWTSTQYQTELLAILKAAETLLQHTNHGQIIIHSTSQAAVKALESPVFTSKIALAASVALDELAQATNTQVLLAWIKPHQKQGGPAWANLLAQQATSLTTREDELVIPTPKSFVKKYINTFLDEKWNARWTSASTSRQSRMFWPAIDEERSKLLLRSDRVEYGTFIRLFTGHNNLNKHRLTTGETDSDTCRLCKEGEESSEHVLCHCTNISFDRQSAIGHPTVDPSQIARVPLDRLRRLIHMIRLRLLEEGVEKI